VSIVGIVVFSFFRAAALLFIISASDAGVCEKEGGVWNAEIPLRGPDAELRWEEL
jgi:hypothetical protein